MGNQNGAPILRDEEVAAFCRTSGLDESEVKRLFSEFLKEHPKGKINHKTFRELMTKAMPGKDAAKMEKHVFRAQDTNNDGYIDFIEFMVIFHVMTGGTPQEILGKIFRVFDINSNNKITKKEMLRLVKDLYGLIKAEIPNAMSEALIAKSVFAEMDADSDGEITLDEFIGACLAQEGLSKMLSKKILDIFLERE